MANFESETKTELYNENVKIQKEAELRSLKVKARFEALEVSKYIHSNSENKAKINAEIVLATANKLYNWLIKTL